MKNIKAAIGTTFTWFFAFVIIFFIIVVFISATTIMSKGKTIFYGSDEINVEDSVNNLRSQEALLNILEDNIAVNDKSLKVRDFIIDGLKNKEDTSSKLNEKLRQILNSSLESGECYILRVEYGLGDVEGTYKKISGLQGAQYYSSLVDKQTIEVSSFNPDPNIGTGSGYIRKLKDSLLQKASVIILLSGSSKNIFGVETDKYEQIKIRFYMGECS
jgi:hypothetical protein